MVANYESWRAARLAELGSPDSWLGLTGLYWLEAGDNRVGSGDDCLVRLPGGPAHLGDLRWAGNELWWQPLGGTSEQGEAGDEVALAGAVQDVGAGLEVAAHRLGRPRVAGQPPHDRGHPFRGLAERPEHARERAGERPSAGCVLVNEATFSAPPESLWERLGEERLLDLGRHGEHERHRDADRVAVRRGAETA